MTDKSNSSAGKAPEKKTGYKVPPKRTQFQKGNPGGPGRPKGVSNAAGILKKMLNDKVPVQENGRRVKKSMGEAMVKRGQQLALTGSDAAYFRALELFDKYGLMEEPAEPIGDLGALGEEMLLLLSCVLKKTIAYRMVEASQPVKPGDNEYLERTVGRWEFSIGADGHIDNAVRVRAKGFVRCPPFG